MANLYKLFLLYVFSCENIQEGKYQCSAIVFLLSSHLYPSKLNSLLLTSECNVWGHIKHVWLIDLPKAHTQVS